jgi:RHS repeat-associated protein
MANESTPPTKGTTEQPAPPDDLLTAAVKIVLTGKVPDKIVQKVEARIVRALAEQPREAVRNKSVEFNPTGLMDTLLDSAIRQFFKDKTDQTVDAVRNAKANANPEGVTAHQNKAQDADPVDLATGQLVYNHIDLSLDGAGIHFEFIRTYRSQAHYPNGPLGAGWDYNLNLWLREVSAEVVVGNSGELREDRYTLTPPRAGAPDETPYYAPPEGFHAILMANQFTGSFDLIRPDGLTYQFGIDPNGTGGLHRIKKIIDTFGNFLDFEYIDNLTTHVIHISVNDPTRVVTLHFDDLGRIDAVGDYSGRVVRYTYDEYDDLVAATLPATKDYRLGRSTFYEYSSERGPVAHQLLSVSDADGRRYLDVEYGNDDGFVDYARVVRQRDDQGEWLLEYANIATDETSNLFSDLIPNDSAGTNIATRYTAMIRPNGHSVEHWFNNRGNLLFKLDSSLDEDGQISKFLWRFLYNADGNMTASLTPEGVLTQHLYGRDQYLLSLGRAATDAVTDDISPSASERRAFANHLGGVRRANPGSGVWPPPFPVTTIFPDDIVTRFTYEPKFQMIASQSDPRVTHSLDPSISTRATKYEYRADSALLNVTHPVTSGPDGILTSPAVEHFDHDAHGRLTKSIDPEGHITQRAYFAAGQTRKPEPVPSTELPLSPMINVSIEGHLQAVTVGKGEPDEATTYFDVNARGSTTEITDPHSFVTQMKIDTTDQPSEVIRVLVRKGKSAVAYLTHFKYTLEGKVKLKDHDLQDEEGNSLFDGHQIHSYRYNDIGQLVRESLGGLDPTKWLVTRHIYNSEGLPTRRISAGGSITHFNYDPRRLLIATTRGFGTPEASTERTRYDGDGRKSATVDGRGNVTRYDYDKFGRVNAIVQIVDHPVGAPDDRALKEREGHTRRLTYDALDNAVLERFFEWRGQNSYVLLSRTSTEYDERGHPIKVIRDLFPDPVSAMLEDFENAAPPKSTSIEIWMFLDGNGRIIERREGLITSGPEQSPGRSTQFTYNASGHETLATIRLLSPKAIAVSQTVTTYDLNGNTIRVDRHDFEHDTQGVVINKEVISREVEYDSLNRRVAEIDGLGNRTEYTYDSRDLYVERRDALGNGIQFDYDLYGRRTTMTEEVDDKSKIITTYSYDDDGQVKTITRGDVKNPSLVTTSYEYDTLHRQTAMILASGTPFERRATLHYDAAGNIVMKIHTNQLREVMEYDGLNRLVRIDFDRTLIDPKLPILGVTFESFKHDGLGRLTHAENDSSTVEASFDSLGRSTKEVQSNGGVSHTIARSFDPLGNRKQLTYPSGRTLHFRHDHIGRLVTIDDVKRGTPNVGMMGGGARSVLHRSYVGTRLREDQFGNNSGTLYEYDAVGRCIAIHHRDHNGASLLRQIHLYDAAGNRRHDWQSGSESNTPSQSYSYDRVHRLTALGKTVTPIPDLTSFLPPPSPRRPLSGQAAMNNALAPLDIPPLEVKDSYTYDTGGNRIGETSPTSNYTVNEIDQINGTLYDHDGNPVTIGNRTLRYDQHRHLVLVEDGNGPIFSASYDALERRITMVEGTNETRFVYDALTEIAEYQNGTLFSEHVVAVSPDERVHLSVGQHEYSIHRDFVGSTSLLLDEHEKRAARYEFDPYGRIVTADEGPFYRYRFMGREWDTSTGLYHFRARHYEVETGRFLQRDPMASEPGRSAYQAFGSNPLIYVDPFGTSRSHRGDPRARMFSPTPVEGERSSELNGAANAILERPHETRSTERTNIDERTRFIDRVINAHRARSARHKEELPDLRPDQLGNVRGTDVKMRRDPAEAASRLIKAANDDLVLAKIANDPDALNTTGITAVSGYRGKAHQERVYRHNSTRYLNETFADRARLDGGEYGEAAVSLMVHYVSPKVAAPGFSNHQAGLAIDLWQERTRGHATSNSTGHAAIDKWHNTWLFKWLKTISEGSSQTNAERFGFHEYTKEPWHWTYQEGQ